MKKILHYYILLTVWYYTYSIVLTGNIWQELELERWSRSRI